ncbi:MAG TPA: vitamin K epoxide reductase family protein [Lacunisphaera sp.]
MLNRILLLLSVLGMVITLHLWVQKERNFDQGCWGFGEGVGSSFVSGCRDPQLQKVSTLLDASLATWGYCFYFLVGTLAFAKILLPYSIARHCHSFSEVAVALAFPFCCYLFYYQVFVAKALCPLCLISGSLVTGLFVVHIVQYRRGGFEPLPESARALELGYVSAIGFVSMSLFAALMIIVNQLGTRRLDQGESAAQFTTMVGRSLPNFIELQRLQEMKPARYASNIPPLKTGDWIKNDIPALGTPSPVNVVIFLDPNCPSCNREFATLTRLSERFKKQAAFYIIPRVLWDYSVLQTQALEIAKRENKYYEMWALQFDRQKQGGMKMSDIEKLFIDLGMDRTGLDDRLEAVRKETIALRDRAQAAGVHFTPTIFINNMAVDAGSNDEPSLVKLIERSSTEK